MIKKDEIKIAIIGLGYVGLPLALEFSKKFKTTGFDINQKRISELQSGHDRTREAEASELAEATNLEFTANPAEIADANIYIVTVPTPIDEHKRPDLRPLISASETVGKLLQPGNVVIYESTVYPGCTEEDCVPILERESGLACAFDLSEAEGKAFEVDVPETLNPKPSTSDAAGGRFFAGYSPERINPGDREHRLPTIRKVTSGSTPEAADFVDALYASIITAGTHKAKNIRVAEAAKVIENTQRDVNIGLINELAMLFGKLGLDTSAVLEAAGTKWNFLPFRPGLVGGHCI
ncbi:MAG TPA: NAD(P)-binding domain-containing protein, partial [Tichowtungia sp.]|nr:NAD(P)-binding domain-containing protein [Tichowtungia sp.]